MGVPGLTTFIDAHPKLLTDYELHDVTVIIDGNNLYHFLYYYYHVPHAYGGDYDTFHSSCASFFKSLESCNVSPYVVFDGAHHEDGRKFKTSLRRAAERVHLAGFLSYGNRAKILPILAYEVFRDVLNDMEIPHVTCYLEADEFIAALSSKWHCPVLTNDSDFFVYDLPAGVILLDYVNLMVKKKIMEDSCGSCKHSTQQYLSIQMYYVNSLMKMFKFEDQKMIALAATLNGNDVVSKNQFEAFYSKVKFRPIKSKQGSKPSSIQNIFAWLRDADNVNDAINRILNYIPERKQERVRSLILQSIKSYTVLDSNVPDRCDQHALHDMTSSYQSAPMSMGGQVLPVWFLDSVRSGAVPARALSAITQRKVILLAQIESMAEPSAYDCSLFLRRCFYSILLTIDGDKQSQEDELTVTEYDREIKDVKGKKVSVIREFSPGVPVPDIQTVPLLTIEQRYRLLTVALSLSRQSVLANESLLDLPEGVRMIALTTIYWAMCASPKVSSLHIQALILCYLALGSLDSWIVSSSEVELSPSNSSSDRTIEQETTENLKADSSPTGGCRSKAVELPSIDGIYTEVPSESLALSSDSRRSEFGMIKILLSDRFTVTPIRNNASTLDSSIIHAYSQFQTCLQAAIHLKQLLLLSCVKALDPSSMLNGIFLYNVMREMESRSDPGLYIKLLLGRDSDVANKFEQLTDAILSVLPAGTLCEHRCNVQRVKKLKLNKQEKKACRVQTCSDNNHDDGDGCGEIENVSSDHSPECEQSRNLGFSLNNKFSCLELS